MMTTTTSRDGFLEKKILMLDKRLTLIEKFVELRFRDTFSTFAAVDGFDKDDGPCIISTRSSDVNENVQKSPKSPLKSKDGGSPTRRMRIIIKEVSGSNPKSNVNAQDEEGEGESENVTTKSKPTPASPSVKKRKVGIGKTDSGGNEGRVTRGQAEAKTTRSNANVVSQGQEIIVADYERPRYNTRGRSRRGRNLAEDEEDCVSTSKNIKKERKLETETVEKDNEIEFASVSSEESQDQSKNDSLSESAEVGIERASADEEEGQDQNEEIEESVVLPPPLEYQDHNEEEEVYFMFPIGSPQQTVDVQPETITGDIEEEAETETTTAVSANYSNENTSNEVTSFSQAMNVDGDKGESDGASNHGKDPEKPEVVKKKRKVGKKAVKTEEVTEMEAPSPPKKRGRKPNPNPQIPKPPRRYPSSSAVTLSSECVAKVDPTKKECPMCHQHIKNEYYQTHLETHMKERHLKCDHCDNRYFNLATLRKHMRVHEPEKYGKGCRLCGKLFYISGKLLAHERFCVKRALESRQFVDPGVIEDLKGRSQPMWSAEISEIMKTVNANMDPSERKECPQCKRTFKATLFEKHLRSHSNTRNWGCSMCTKAYYHKNDLKRHIAADHTNIVCAICSSLFADKAQLKLHRKSCSRKSEGRRNEVRNLFPEDRVQPHSAMGEALTQAESNSSRTEEMPTEQNIVILETTGETTLVLVNANDHHNDHEHMQSDSDSPSKAVPYTEVIVESTEDV